VHEHHVSFSLAVHGGGRLVRLFEDLLKIRYPGVTVYLRNSAQDHGPAAPMMPPHPEVADVDAVFVRSGRCEQITLRCGGHHRFFNCVADAADTRETERERLLNLVVNTVEEMLAKAAADAAAAVEAAAAAAAAEAAEDSEETASEPSRAKEN